MTHHDEYSNLSVDSRACKNIVTQTGALNAGFSNLEPQSMLHDDRDQR